MGVLVRTSMLLPGDRLPLFYNGQLEVTEVVIQVERMPDSPMLRVHVGRQLPGEDFWRSAWFYSGPRAVYHVLDEGETPPGEIGKPVRLRDEKGQ